LLEAIDKAIGETIDQDAELRGRRDLLLSVIGVGETLAAALLAEMLEPGVLRRSGEMVAYAGLNPSHHRSGSSIDRPTFAVGTPISERPPHRSVRAGFPHTAPTSGV